MFYWLTRTFLFIVLRCFSYLEVRGREIIPQRGPFILAANHISNLDPIVLGIACPRRLRFLAKEELFTNRVFNLIIRALGAIPLRRGVGDFKVIRKALKVLKREPLVIFPQGTRTDDFATFRTGVGFLKRKSGVSVVAARIYGSDKVLPKESIRLRRGTIKVIFSRLNALERNDDYKTIALKVIERIKSL